jgi:RsmE family RNA methyltransferase
VNLILFEPHEIDSDGRVAVGGTRAAHLTRVLQVSIGSTIRVGMIDGPCGVATVDALTRDHVSVRCAFDTTIPERPSVDLLLALPRPKVLRRLWPQLAALGVGRIMLTNAARVERNYFDTHLLDPSIVRPLLIEGLQQARDTRVPIVSVHKQLKVFVEDDLGHSSDACRLYADPLSTAGVATAIAARSAARVLLAVGPEGGWIEYERQMLADHGFLRVTLGPRTLRSDTACIALLAVVHASIGTSSSR